MLMLETYEDNRLRALYQKQAENEYYYDKHVQYKDFKLYLTLEKEVDALEKILHARRLFNGKPHEWQGNMITLSICPECRLSEKCVEWNQYLEKPKKHYDKFDNEIEYDRAGNRKYQFVNLKTGESI